MDISVKECWWDPQGAPTGKIDRHWNRLKQGFIGSIAFRNEAMICRLFVLTVLWDRSKTDHLTQKGGDLSPNRNRPTPSLGRPLFLPKETTSAIAQNPCGLAYLPMRIVQFVRAKEPQTAAPNSVVRTQAISSLK